MALLQLDRKRARHVAPSEIPKPPRDLEFSLTHGGPFYRLTVALGLVRDEAADVLRLTVAGLVVTWLPLALLAAIDSLVAGRQDLLLRDPLVEVRLWGVMPLLFFSARWLHVATRDCLREFLDDNIAGDDGPAAKRVLQRTMRWRDAWVPELVLGALALAAGLAVLLKPAESGALFGNLTVDTPASVARCWFALVALPLQLFLAFQAAWRWGLWCVMLFRLSRLKLRPDAAHPDGRGGLARFSEPSVALAPALSAVVAVTAARWFHELRTGGESFDVLKPYFAVFILTTLVITLAPVTVFFWHLRAARKRGITAWGALNLDCARAFHRQWLGVRGDHADLRQTRDAQSLADLAHIYSVVKRTRRVPIDALRVITILGITLAPLVPLALTQVSLLELTTRVLKRFIGG